MRITVLLWQCFPNRIIKHTTGTQVVDWVFDQIQIWVFDDQNMIFECKQKFFLQIATYFFLGLQNGFQSSRRSLQLSGTKRLALQTIIYFKNFFGLSGFESGYCNVLYCTVHLPVLRIRDVYPGSWKSDPGSNNKKGGRKTILVLLFVATNFTKVKIILFLNTTGTQKHLSQISKNYTTFYSNNCH